MNRTNLHDEFIKGLHERFPNRKQLVETISDILRIEREPASRRLSGKVQFSVQEMGIIASELDIAIDSLLHKNQEFVTMPIALKSPMNIKSMDNICDTIERTIGRANSIVQAGCEFGTIFHLLPFQLYVSHPYLMKFMFFKWGHNLIGTDEFSDFGKWKIPERLLSFEDKINSFYENIEHPLFIWDNSLMWELAREIEYLYKMRVISTEDMKNIKSDLKAMLDQLEKSLKGNCLPNQKNRNLSFYVSHINVGLTSFYISSETSRISHLHTSFSASMLNENLETFTAIKDWVDSFKSISVLISGSGSLERRLFFKRQLQIIDFFLSEEQKMVF
ncbi:hypothetical protein LJC53_03935 [Bacteroidales bacterium OttesenSCG-928-C03]|nr:hypothetical protein [Bacteroidales bacterium OttesenSCG-928-C03]